MPTSLRDIPGAGGPKRRRQGSGLGGLGAQRRGRLRRGGAGSRKRPMRISTRTAALPLPRQIVRRVADMDRMVLVLTVSFLGLGVFGLFWAWETNSVNIRSEGMEDEGGITSAAAEDLEIELVLDPADRLEDATLEFQGEDVTEETESTDTGWIWKPDPEHPLDEGDYQLRVTVPRIIAGTATWTLDFAVDDTPPLFDELPDPEPAEVDEGVVLRGQLDERGTITSGEQVVTVDDENRFELRYDHPPPGPVELVAADLAGNLSRAAIIVPVDHDAGRGLALTASSWADGNVRARVLDLVEAGHVQTVEITIKDECGVVGWGTDVDLAGQVGATTETIDLDEAADEVHDRGGRLVGRIVAFRDPVFTRWAWANGHQDWVLQDGAGDPWPEAGQDPGCVVPETAPEVLVGGFANLGSQPVWQYNLDLALDAVDVGVDGIVWDEVRRPAGDVTAMQILGHDGPADQALIQFLTLAHIALRAEGAYQGVVVSGPSVVDPAVVAQNVTVFAAHTDYVAPQVFPSALPPGFIVGLPEADPVAIVRGLVPPVVIQSRDTPADVVPRLQAFNGTVPFLAPQVRDEIEALGSLELCDWVLVDPEARYDADLVEPSALC